jgi:hypothetical protein
MLAEVVVGMLAAVVVGMLAAVVSVVDMVADSERFTAVAASMAAGFVGMAAGTTMTMATTTTPTTTTLASGATDGDTTRSCPGCRSITRRSGGTAFPTTTPTTIIMSGMDRPADIRR